ncbi:phage tail protein, partial [Raoultella ornithinolytica]
SDFYSDGTARKIEFTLSLKRVDESLMTTFGDLRTQASELVESARNSIGGLVG